MSDFITDETTAEGVHFEDGVGMYSDVSDAAAGFCSMCFQDALQVRQLSSTEFTRSGMLETYKTTSLCVCVGCLARMVNALPHATLSQGIVNDVA